MSQNDEIRINVRIHSRYQVFDQSGSLPFSILFGLARRSHQDTDNKTLILNTSKSVFDVPYALANGLLILYEGGQGTHVDLSSLHADPGPDEFITVPALHRKARLDEDFETFLRGIESKSELARLLKPEKEYAIRLASRDLGVKWWRYGNVPSEENSETAKLVNSSDSAGKAAFTTRATLPIPPKLNIGLNLRFEADKNFLEASITLLNTERPFSIQSSGHQRYLTPWGPCQPLEPFDNRMRLTSASPLSTMKSKLIIRLKSDGSIVHKLKPPVCRGLYSGPAPDRRPVRSNLTTLYPGVPVVRSVHLTELMIEDLKLQDGKYLISLEGIGAWWYEGSVEEIFQGLEENMKIPQEVYKMQRPPVWLESADEVLVGIHDEKIMLGT